MPASVSPATSTSRPEGSSLSPCFAVWWSTSSTTLAYAVRAPTISTSARKKATQAATRHHGGGLRSSVCQNGVVTAIPSIAQARSSTLGHRRYQSAAGGSTFSAHNVANWKDGNVSGSSIGTDKRIGARKSEGARLCPIRHSGASTSPMCGERCGRSENRHQGLRLLWRGEAANRAARTCRIERPFLRPDPDPWDKMPMLPARTGGRNAPRGSPPLRHAYKGVGLGDVQSRSDARS